jgi:hypothetical protein
VRELIHRFLMIGLSIPGQIVDLTTDHSQREQSRRERSQIKQRRSTELACHEQHHDPRKEERQPIQSQM